MARRNVKVEEVEVVGTAPVAPVAPIVADVRSPAELIQEYGNKSKAIRALSASGHKTAEIAKMLGIRYQFVRNVLVTPIKKVEAVQPVAEGGGAS